MNVQIRPGLFFLIIFLPAILIFIKRQKLRKIAFSFEKDKLAILSGVALFIAVLNSIVFSWLSMVILDSIELDRVIGDAGMFAAMILVPVVPSWLISRKILAHRRWVYFTVLLTLLTGSYLILSCFYCFGSSKAV